MTTLLLLVRRSLRQHALSTTVTMLNIALACGLVMAVFSIRAQSEQAFTADRLGFDAVLGARGNKLQLVLNAVFHLEVSPGNLPWATYQAIKTNPNVELAIPYALGDNYYGFRLVGTTNELFDALRFEDGAQFETEAGGRFFDVRRREAVVGSFAARKTGLQVGSTIKPFHGLNFNPKEQHGEEYTVVGILKPTNSPADRVIWIPLEGVYRMSGHVLRGSEKEYIPEAGTAIPDEDKEVSAVMLKFTSPQAGFALDYTINRQGKVATLAFPIGTIMAELFDKIGWMTKVVTLIAYLVLVVAAGSITASIYNTMNERRRDFAILRALGARRRTVFAAIVLEAGTISCVGGLVGYLVYGGILVGARWVLREETGVLLNLFFGHPALIWTPLAMIVLGAACGIVPAVKAYSTDVASNLSPVT